MRLEAHLGYWLRFVSNHVLQSFQRKVEGVGVTVSEWVVLRELYRLGPTSPHEIARVLGMSKGAISKLVTRLERKTLVTQHVREEDRRARVVALTAKTARRLCLYWRVLPIKTTKSFLVIYHST